MRIRMILSAVIMAALALPGIANADVIHRISFTSKPVVHIWEAGAAVQSGQRVQVGIEAAPAKIPFYTGVLEPIPASASIEAGTLELKIASNTGFRVEAEALDSASLPGPVTVTVAGLGENASLPGVSDLSRQISPFELATTGVIFAAPERTAAKPGTLASQAITLRIESGAPLVLTVTAIAP